MKLNRGEISVGLIIVVVIAIVIIGGAFALMRERVNLSPPDEENKNSTTTSLTSFAVFKPYSGPTFTLKPLDLNSAPTNNHADNSETVDKPATAKLEIQSTTNAKATDPQKEYITIFADKQNSSPINISNLSLINRGNTKIKIGQAANIFTSVAPPQKSDVYLPPGGKAVVHTGRSQLGVSFRLNKCSGFLTQYHSFGPTIQSYSCPKHEDYELPTNIEDACVDFIERIPSCRFYEGLVPLSLSDNCRNYINQNINYDFCVNKHKNDSDFFLNEWRIYLNRSEELFAARREEIKLVDEENNILSILKY